MAVPAPLAAAAKPAADNQEPDFSKMTLGRKIGLEPGPLKRILGYLPSIQSCQVPTR